MNDYSMVILVGRLTKDPELKYSENGALPYATLRMSICKTTQQGDGKIKKTTSFMKVLVWRHQAEIVCQMTRKGSIIMVVGSLRQIRWSNAEGKRLSRIEIHADRVQFLDKKVAESLPVQVVVK